LFARGDLRGSPAGRGPAPRIWDGGEDDDV
jgi:hypothetical protein